jgi:hypothetical protein
MTPESDDQMHDRRPREPEDMIDALAPQCFHGHFGAVHIPTLFPPVPACSGLFPPLSPVPR